MIHEHIKVPSVNTVKDNSASNVDHNPLQSSPFMYSKFNCSESEGSFKTQDKLTKQMDTHTLKVLLNPQGQQINQSTD